MMPLRLAPLVFAMLLPLAIYTAWEYIEVRRLYARNNQISQKGEPVSVWEALRSETPLTPKSEAYRFYRAAAALASLDKNAPSDGAEALVLLDRAASLPFDGFPAGFRYDYLAGDLMMLSELANRRTAKAIQADMQGFATSLVAELSLQHVLIRHLREGTSLLLPRVMSHVHAALARMELDAPSLARLETALAPLDDDDAIKRYFTASRAVHLELDLPTWRFPGSGPPPWRLHARNESIDTFTSLLVAANLPWPSRLDALGVSADWSQRAVTATDYSARDGERWLRTLGAFHAQSHAWNLSVVRTLRYAIALERYRREHNGTLPAAAPDLIPAYLPAIPIDPYAGRALMFAVQGPEYVVYSAGNNRRDDGGNVGTDVPRGFRELENAYDLGVRVRYK